MEEVLKLGLLALIQSLEEIQSEKEKKCINISNILEGHTDSVYSIRYSPDGKTLASGSLDKTVRIWDIKSGECLHVLKGHSDAVHYVCYSPDGKTLSSSSADKTVILWDINNDKCVS